jgi:hypothetical protein
MQALVSVEDQNPESPGATPTNKLKSWFHSTYRHRSLPIRRRNDEELDDKTSEPTGSKSKLASRKKHTHW